MRFTGCGQWRRTVPPLAIFLLYLPIAAAPDLRLAVPEWIGFTAVIVILLSLILFLAPSIENQWSDGFILLMAAVLRGLFLWRAPELSDDIYRYLFDGLILVNGRNPYALAPADAATAMPALSALAGRVNHAELPTIYPPAAQFVFAFGAVLGNVGGMKLAMVLVDLAGCALILKLLDRLRLPRNNAVIYAWHPLPVMEIAASGHIDAAAVALTFLALFFLLAESVPERPSSFDPVKTGKQATVFTRPGLAGWTAGVCFALAVLTKWTPLIFAPGLLPLTTSNNRRYAGLGFLTAVAVMIGLFWPEVQNAFYTLSVYVANWEFSGFVFRRLRSATGSGNTARLIIAGTFVAAMGAIYFRRIQLARRTSPAHARDVFHCFYATAVLFLFLNPTLHPWYGLYLVAFLPFAAGPAGIVLSWSIFLSYRVVILYAMTGQWIESDFIPFLIMAAPAGALAAGLITRPACYRGYR
ncbi:MAG: glycosyltransferase 87 family protein [Thermodesulfobacteriota bacterium]